MVLTILKIIGIILLVLLLLIIFILSLVLFVPIRYRFSAEYFENPDVLAVVRYVPVGLNAQVAFRENGLQYTIKALGGVIMTNTDARLSWLGRKISGGQSEENNDISASSDLQSAVLQEQDIMESTADSYNSVSNGAEIENTTDREEENSETDNIIDNTEENAETNHTIDNTDIENKRNNKKRKDKNNKQKPKKEKKDKDRRPLSEKIEEKINNIRQKYKEIKEKISKLNKKKDSLIKVYKSKRFETAKADVIRYIKEILRAVKPQHVEGRVHFGLDDPAATGEIIGGLAMILPLYDGYIDIRPDFERKIIEGLLKGYGKIRLWSLTKIVLKVIFNKNLIKVVKRVKTIVEA